MAVSNRNNIGQIMRIGIFGGSFDPVHYGHLILAETCREACRLDKLVFMPAALSPHKLGSQPAPPDARVEMLQLAIGGHESFEISRSEIDRGGVSYTVDTLAEFQTAHEGDELFFLMGGDSLDDFPNWREPARIGQIATLVVVSRPPHVTPNFEALRKVLQEEQVAAALAHHVQMPQVDISSSEIRDRIRDGRSIRYQTPRAVEKYIQTQKLYLDDTAE
jgi:nicotinate-nucleotide adenylyltransferase